MKTASLLVDVVVDANVAHDLPRLPATRVAKGPIRVIRAVGERLMVFKPTIHWLSYVSGASTFRARRGECMRIVMYHGVSVFDRNNLAAHIRYLAQRFAIVRWKGFSAGYPMLGVHPATRLP